MTFECIFGCSGNSGSSSSHLNRPQMMFFDTNGNIFVTDVGNHRIQKFVLARNSCGMYAFSFKNNQIFCLSSNF